MSSIAAGDSQDSVNCDCPQISIPGQSSKCKADSSESEKSCETESLQILEEFKKLYESRIDEVDKNTSIPEFERISTKLKIMTDWVEDLKEQNVMLVRTVEDLEKAAVNRVTLLEDKLLQSSNLISENIAQYTNSGEALHSLSNRISELEGDDYLKNKIEYLQSDIRGLLELIRRAHENNCWSHDGITFLEIKPEDIPVPFDCTCNEEKGGAQNQDCNITLKTMQDNEKILLEKVEMLEQQVSQQKKIILQKEKAYKTFSSKVQTLRDNLEKQSSKTMLDTSDNLDFDIVEVADILESAFVAKDLEIKNLHQCLQESNGKLEKLMHENEKFEEKNKQIQEFEIQLADLQKESLESKEALASEVAEKYDQVIALRKEIQDLEDKCHHLSMQTQFKEDIIKDLRKELKQVSQKDSSHSRHVRINTEPCSVVVTEDSPSSENNVIMYLSKTKQLMEKEKETFTVLKDEIIKVITELHSKENQEVRENISVAYKILRDMEILLKAYTTLIDNNSSVEKMKNCFTDIEENMASLLTILQNLYEDTEGKSQSTVGEIIKRLSRVTNKISEICTVKEESFENVSMKEEASICDNTCNDQNHELAIKTILQQFKKMEEFRIFTVEAQAATEDLREEMESVICNFTCRHETYCELNKQIAEIHNYIITTKEKISKTISQLKLQEEERKRYNERISSGGNKLKDMKNEINQARMQFSRYVTSVQQNNQELGNISSTEMYTSNNVLNIVADEVEQIVSNLQAVREKEHCTELLLSELDIQFTTVQNNLEKLYNKSQEVLKANEVNQKIFEEKEKRINKSENELDCAHTNMQDALETIFSAMDEINEFDIVKDKHFVNQDVNEIIKIKNEYHKLKREYESLRMKMVEDSYKKEVDQSINNCKCQITNLLGQIRILQNEIKIGQDANNILKNHIQVLEKELNGANKKSEDNRRSFSNESMQYHRKISDLESTLRKQKEIESNLRRTVASSEIELKKSKEALNSFQINSEGALSALGTRGTNVENCFAEMEKLRDALHSKEKLLEDKEQIITIQKDSIFLTQKEIKDLHEKLQEKIDAQNNVIAHLDKDNKQLQNTIELQVQTIGHLQNAVVQTKRCLDQMGQKFVSDKEKKNEAIRTLNIFLNETQRQYSECFAEAAKQDSLLEVQRDSIESLQQKIICKEYNELCKIILLHCIYSANVFHLQEQLKICTTDCETLKSQIESLKTANKSLEEKYLSAKYLWKDTDFELNQMKHSNKSCSTKIIECKIGDQEMRALQLEYNALIEKNTDLTKELQKCNMDFDFVKEELKKQNKKSLFTENLQTELERLNVETQKLKSELERENEDLNVELQKCKVQFKMIQEELRKQSTEYIPKLKSELNEKENRNEELVEKLKLFEEKEVRLTEKILELEVNHREIKELKAKILFNEQEAENFISDLNSSEKMQDFFKILLDEKSDCMAKLQADYQVLKNDYSILKMEYGKLEAKAKEEICELHSKKKEIQLQLAIAENDYETVTQDFNKSQELLNKSVNQEAELQQKFTNQEKRFYSKVMDMEEEEIRLKELVKKLKEELEHEKEEVSSKKLELEKIQSACHLFSSQLEETQYDLQGLKEKNLKLQNANCCCKKKLQESREENSKLLRQIKFLEQNNYKYSNELEDMHNLLVDLKKECKMKNKSLASMTAELSQATASRSELRNESQYVVSCIRDWMEEQNNIVDSLNEKLKTKQQQLEILGFQKKALLSKIKEQKRIVNALKQKRKRSQRSCKSYSPNSGIMQIRSEPSSNYSLLPKKCLARRSKKLVCGSSWFLPKIEYLTKALRQRNEIFNEKLTFQSENDLGFDENRDCGYQSSTSK